MPSPYLVEVGEILHDLGASVQVVDRLPLGDLDTPDTRFRLVEPPLVDALLTNAGDGVVLSGSVTAHVETECSRCLEPFVLTVSATLEGFYTTPDKAAELPEDQEWEPLHLDAVDIAPAVESALRLELPFAPLHAEDCAGICPVCGCNLNEQSCDCASAQAPAGPFDALKDLFPDEGEG